MLSCVLVLVNRYSLRVETDKVFLDKQYTEDEYRIPVTGDHVVRQQFVAEHGIVSKVRLHIANPDQGSTTGTIIVLLEDAEGNQIAATEIDAAAVKPTDGTTFVLNGDSASANADWIVENVSNAEAAHGVKINKGEIYTLVIDFDDVRSNGNLALNVKKGSNPEFEAGLDMDGETLTDTSIKGAVIYRRYSTALLRTYIVLLLIAAAAVLFPWTRLSSSSKPAKAWPWLILILTPIVSYFIIQKYADSTLSGFISQLMSICGVLNLIIILAVMGIVHALTGRIRMTAIITCLLMSLFGFANYCLILFRDYPLIAADFGQIGVAMDVAGSYSVWLTDYGMMAVFITIIWCVIALAADEPGTSRTRQRAFGLAAACLMAGCIYGLFFASDYVSEHGIRVSGWKPKSDYSENGSFLSFMVTLAQLRVEKPDGYSLSAVNEILGGFESDPAELSGDVSEKNPNMIFIMNEAFSDLSVFGQLETNEDYMPFFRGIKDNAVKGWMYTSTFGGGTANTEFEYLTGFTKRFLPYSTPYVSNIKEEVHSITYDMIARGYIGNIAFHPGTRNSYNRNVVYPRLGFESQISIEDLPETAKIRNFTSDAYDYSVIEEQYETYRENSNEPFYMFNVTIQNHGSYGKSRGEVDHGIEILEPDKSTEQATQYLNLIKYSDEALEDLIDYYDGLDEPTVLVFFGDHQPRLEDEFYAAFDDENANLSDTEKNALKYKVPFLIWANYDIDEDADVELSANYLASYVRDILDLPMSAYDKYLMDIYQSMPVVTAECVKDAAGNIYENTDGSGLEPIITDYRIVQYNGLIDGKHRDDSLFNLRIGY